MQPQATTFLLTIRGQLAPSSVEAARVIHNETAGAPDSVAAARALGDLSHMLYVPAGAPPAKGAGELLIMDNWNDPMGLMKFFENKQVQEQGGRIFATRDPVVWAPAAGALSVELSAPAGKNDRFVGILRGNTKARGPALKAFDEISLSGVNEARKLGLMSHHTYWRFTPPGAPESTEMISVQTWYDGEGMQKYYSVDADMSMIFVGEPDASAWMHPAGSWVEW